MDTIFALATAHGKAGVAIVRVSGPYAWNATSRLCKSLPSLRVASLRVLSDETGLRLDEALVILFPEKESFTGERVAELHLHGSVAVVAAVLSTLGAMADLRQAEPGEFTRRALENGRLDLAQVEGLADLIDAETEAQRKQALRVLSGDLGTRAAAWRRDLIRAAALLEATIDFADEDVPVDVIPEVDALLATVSSDLEREIAGVNVAERVRAGFEVAIVGAPNVGKSTLLNRLAGREAAITSEYAGTTRDVIEVRMDLSGIPVTLLDTAGLRDTDDHVESIGIVRARARAASSDLRVFLVESGALPEMTPEPHDIVVASKSDLSGVSGGVSGLTGDGVGDLVARITDVLQDRVADIGVATRVRHRVALERSVVGLASARRTLEAGIELADIAAEDLRVAVRALDVLVGRVDVENILDEIFSSFCIGK